MRWACTQRTALPLPDDVNARAADTVVHVGCGPVDGTSVMCLVSNIQLCACHAVCVCQRDVYTISPKYHHDSETLNDINHLVLRTYVDSVLYTVFVQPFKSGPTRTRYSTFKDI